MKSSPRVLVIEGYENIVKKAETRTFQMQVARFRSIQNSGRSSVLKLEKRKTFAKTNQKKGEKNPKSSFKLTGFDRI